MNFGNVIYPLVICSLKNLMPLLFFFIQFPSAAEETQYEVILVHDEYINIANVNIMLVDYAKDVLDDYADVSLHVRGHLCADSDNLYKILKHVFETNSRKPVVSTYGDIEDKSCRN